MKVKFLTILILLAFASCSNTNQNQNINNSSSTNVSVENRSANKDFTKPVNLNNPKERKNADKLIEELDKNLEIWKAQNVSDYDYICEALPVGMTGYNPASIKVRDGKAYSSEEISKSEGVFHYNYEKMNSIDKIFDFLKQELEEGSYVNVKYNKKFGYPENFWVGYGIGAHNNNAFVISKFVVLKKN